MSAPGRTRSMPNCSPTGMLQRTTVLQSPCAPRRSSSHSPSLRPVSSRRVLQAREGNPKPSPWHMRPFFTNTPSSALANCRSFTDSQDVLIECKKDRSPGRKVKFINKLISSLL
ncbi:unnamed protein product [Ixodes pacificus]